MAAFDTEIRDTHGMAVTGDRALWMLPGLSAVEKAGLAAEWTMAAYAPVLSADMARIHILWRHGHTGSSSSSTR